MYVVELSEGTVLPREWFIDSFKEGITTRRSPCQAHLS